MSVALTLKVYRGDALVMVRDFDRDMIRIGKLSTAHLCLEDEKVSRIHAVIESTPDGGLSVMDMGSVEGTWLNGKRISKGPLQFGDELRLGGLTVRVEARGAAAAAAAPTTQPSVVVAMAPPPPPPPEVLYEAGPATLPNMPAVSDVAAVPPRQLAPAAGVMGLSLRIRWGADQLLAEHLLRPGKESEFRVGSGEGVDFVMGDRSLGGSSFTLARSSGGGFQVFAPRGARTVRERAGESATVVDASGGLQVAAGELLTVDLGGIFAEATLQPLPAPVVVPWGENVDYGVLNVFLVMFFLAGLFVVTAFNRDAAGDAYADELSGANARLAKLIVKPPETQKNPFLEKLKQQKEDSEMAAKRRGDEGQMGKKDETKKNARAAPKGDPTNKDQARMLTEKIFGGKDGGGISTIFGHNGLGGELKSAMGNMFGAAAGDAQGLGGLGLRGGGSGGGGVGDTIGIGGIGTKGRGGGTGSYGTGIGGMNEKKQVDIGIASSDPTVVGSLDKELIRQVIRRNRNQVKYCYELQLQRNPKLAGKVSIKFVITADGTVASSQVASSTVNNAELETCVAGRVRAWEFPKPKGGGVVVVTYPFVFNQSGG
ncbi:MAG: hypothetical protein RL653_4081 [Pseudomonadota bacterium]